MRLCAFCETWIKESRMVLVERVRPGPGPVTQTRTLHRGACKNVYLFRHREYRVVKEPVWRRGY